MPKKAKVRRSALGVLLALWWTSKAGQSDTTLSLSDAAILAGLGLCWWLEKQAAREK